MIKSEVPKFEVLVAGQSGIGKTKFINRFLHDYPSSAEVHRESGVTYFAHIAGKNIKMQLHDVRNIENIDRKCYNKMDVVLLFYTANDPQTLQILEKWLNTMTVFEEEPHSSVPEAKKEVYSFLVADSSDLGSQQDVAECLSQKAKKLKEAFGITRFVESSFEDEESSSFAFKTIFDEVIVPKLEKIEYLTRRNEFANPITDRFSREPPKYVDKTSQFDISNFGDVDLEKQPDYYLDVKKTAKMFLDVLEDKCLSTEEKIDKLRNCAFQNLNSKLSL